jgi:hypothetical protein
LLALGVAPALLVLIKASGDDLVLLLPMAMMCAALVGYPGALILALDRRGIRMVPVRGGAGAQVEIRAKDAAGGGLIVPISTMAASLRVFSTGIKKVGYFEASAESSAGDVFLVTAGASVPRELIAWFEALLSASGSGSPSEGALDIEEIAAAASRDPFSPLPGIEAAIVDGWPTYRYRAGETRARWWLISIAIATASLLIGPTAGLGTMAGMATFVAIVEAGLLYGILLCGPVTAEFQVRGPMLVCRRRRFGLTLWISARDARRAGVDLTGLPNVAIRCAGRVLAVTGPSVGGPDAGAVAWLAAAIRATATASTTQFA